MPKLVALIMIQDQIRREAYDTIKYFRDNGVNVKVISGDNPVTVSEVAKRVGIQNAENFISLDGLSDQEVMEAANSYTVFGRVKPNQKKLLVQAMKAKKHTVAMTGDGVNDILALKEADCSIAMASGSEAVRNVAQLVLLDSNFASMPKVVAEGRRVINNIQGTASIFFVKTLFSFIISLFIIFNVIGITKELLYPFEPQQLAMIELLTIGIPTFFLALQPNKNRITGRFLWNVIRNALPGALTIATGGRVQRRQGALEFHGGFSRWLLCRRVVMAQAMTLGHVIIGRDPDCLESCREHEQAHVRQVERWGAAFLPAYVFASACAWSRGEHYYLDNWFERDARRACGEP
jgi:magnesium-transporting ATPase (P-type)